MFPNIFKIKGSILGCTWPPLQVKTPTRNRVYSRVYRQVLAEGASTETARVKAREECNRLAL